jgi:hypothetical protein
MHRRKTLTQNITISQGNKKHRIHNGENGPHQVINDDYILSPIRIGNIIAMQGP